MSDLKEIKNRIGSTRSMRQVTRTMEMVATAKIRGAQNRIERARPYMLQLAKILLSITRDTKKGNYPLLVNRKEKKKTLVISIASDRGQAGAFNANIINLTEKIMTDCQDAGKEVELICLGRKTNVYFNLRSVEPVLSIEGSSGQPTRQQAKELSDRIIDQYSDATIDEVILVFNRFVNVASQHPEIMTLLPISTEDVEFSTEGGIESSGAELDYLYEPSAESVLDTLSRTYVEVLIYRALLESAASEHGARRTAMKSATDNAEAMIKTLTRSYNRARQAAITTEIAEIVGGAAALEG
jgi:F-type H+-transporting ATPase subunit gamma